MTGQASTAAVARISALCDLRRFGQAAEEAGRHLSSDPGDVHVLCLLAEARLGDGHPDGALDAARAAVALHPSAEWPHRLASAALEQLGRYAHAVMAAETAVGAAPLSPLTHVRLANARRAHGVDLTGARRAAEQAVALGPDLVEAHLALGAVHAVDRRQPEAAGAFRTALRLDPQCVPARTELARLELAGPHPPSGAGLASAASGFAGALRADPTARAGRHNLDLVLFVLVERVFVFVLFAGILGTALALDTDVPRVGLFVPLAVLAVLLPFAGQFLVRLSASLRVHVVRSLRQPMPGLPLACLAVGAVLVVVGAAVPELAPAAFPVAGLIAIAVRVGLGRYGRKVGFLEPRRRR